MGPTEAEEVLHLRGGGRIYRADHQGAHLSAFARDHSQRFEAGEYCARQQCCQVGRFWVVDLCGEQVKMRSI